MVRPASPLTWATDDDYASGVDSGTPTKSTPTPAERAQGFIPDVGADGQAINALLNNYAAWIEHTRLMRDQDWIPIDVTAHTVTTIDQSGMKGLAYRVNATMPDNAIDFFVSAFGGTTTYRSVDGINWNLGGAFTSGALGIEHHKSIIFSQVAGLWIAGLASGSTDKVNTTPAPLTTWTARTLPGTSGNRFALAESGSIVVLAGDVDFHSSTDGITWTARTNPTTDEQRGVVWSGSLFVSVGKDGQVASSTDGITWTDRSSGVPVLLQLVDFIDVTFDPGSGKFVAIGTNGKIMTSTDGITWTDKSISLSISADLRAIVSDGNDTIYMCDANNVYRSRDGADEWSVQRLPSTVAANSFVTYADGRPIVFGDHSTAGSEFGIALGMRTEAPHANIIP